MTFLLTNASSDPFGGFLVVRPPMAYGRYRDDPMRSIDRVDDAKGVRLLRAHHPGSPVAALD